MNATSERTNARRPLLSWPFLPARIGARLYLLSGLALTTVAVLATAAMHFVTLAGETGANIRARVQVELVHVTELELLLERHRRIIESAPVELDRERIAALRIHASELIAAMTGHVPGPGAAFVKHLAATLPELARQGDATLHLAWNFAQGAAIDQAATYTVIARRLAGEIAAHKAGQLAAVDHDVTALVASGGVLTRWVIAGSMLALVLIGPVSLLVTSQIVRRLKTMTATMLRLAANDTAVHISGTRFRDELGDMARAMGVFKSNATALLAYQGEIEALNRRFEFALENMSRGLSMFDSAHRLIVCNRHYRDLYGLPPELARPGTPFEDIIAHRMRAGTARMGESAEAGRLPWPFDNPAAPPSGELIQLTHELANGRIVEIAYQPLDGGGWVALHEDVTAERMQDVRIERLAHTDTVTGIANRHSFQEVLARALSEIETGGAFAVHWIDLDRFKAVNDTFGHPVGDALLEQVAARLTQAVRTEDFVARLGGDEFAVIQRHATPATADPLAQRLIRVLSAPYALSGHHIEIGASAGVVFAPEHGANAEDLIRNADIALYQAKADGRGCRVIFETALAAGIKARRGLEADILEALETGGFEMHYQPILDLKTGEVAVCEALMRWSHPVRGPVSPAVFIPVAEEMGVIDALGAFALSRACTDASGWPGDIKVAVNLSAVQFADRELAATVMRVLAATSLPAHRLELEITETVLMRDDAATIATLEQLRAAGIAIALDDFGTGFSSLNYLRRFPFDKIKIDQSFIRDLPSRTECVAIVRAVADLAKTLGMRTVAEGVETADHLNRVVQAGCDQVQGYLISRPVANAAVPAAIAGASKSAVANAA